MAESSVPLDAQKKRALQLLLGAWEQALRDGVAPETVATTAVFLALSDMIEAHGEEAVSAMAAELPQRIRAGEFTLGPR